MWFQELIEVLFGLALFINAALFVPQAMKLLKKKDSSELSLMTFAGFNAIQLITVIYGIYHQDYILIAGYALSFATCGIVTVLIIYFRK